MSPDAIDHLDLVVSSLERSLPFYKGLLSHFGYVREAEIVGEQGERVIYIGRATLDGGSVSVREKRSDAHEVPYDRYGIGIHHIAFSAYSRKIVDASADYVRGAGCEIESGPREYPQYTPGYYAVFFHDPDGIKLEVVHRPREQELVRLVEELAERIDRLERGIG